MSISDALDGRTRIDINTYLGDDVKFRLKLDGVDLSGYTITWEIFRKFSQKPAHQFSGADLTVTGDEITSSAIDRNITEALGTGIHRHHLRFDDGSRKTYLSGAVNVSDVHTNLTGPPADDFRFINN